MLFLLVTPTISPEVSDQLQDEGTTASLLPSVILNCCPSIGIVMVGATVIKIATLLMKHKY